MLPKPSFSAMEGDMRRLATFVLFGLCTVALGCGSSNSPNGPSAGGTGGTMTGKAGGTTAAGGSTGNGGTTAAGGSTDNGGATAAGGSTGNGGATAAGGAGGGTGTSACILPSCLKNFDASCAPTGACTKQEDLGTGDKNFCYANGVKKITVLNIGDSSTALTMTKSGSTCFTTAYNGNDFFNSAGDLIVNDASGATIATLDMDADTSTLYIVTCPGADPVTLNESCNNSWPVSGLTDQSNGDCTAGTCTP
jgi:hypothetical protein